MITHQSICFACIAIWNERERENKRRTRKFSPSQWWRSWFQFQFVGIFPSVRNFLVRYIFLLYSSSSFLFFYPWLLMIRQQGPQISERRMVHFMNKSGSVHQRLRLPFMLHQGQVLWLSCFSAGLFFFCLRPTRHQSPSQNTGWIRIGLELFLLIFPVGGSWLLRQEQPVHYISLNTYIGDQERGRPCFF